MIDRKSLEIRRRKGLKMCRRYRLHDITPRQIGRNGATPVSCSCWMCGNPRRNFRGWERLTIHELRKLQETREMEQEIDAWRKNPDESR